MRNNLARLFGKLRRCDENHADEGFQVTSEGESIRVERRIGGRRSCSIERRAGSRDMGINRRTESIVRRLGVDWRAWR